MKDTRFETKREMRNGNLVEFVPIVVDCTYYQKDEHGECRNCHGTRKYVVGYHMIITNPKGEKTGFEVDTLK